MNKKDREEIILKKIYNSSKINIEEIEEPDFKISNENETFGVEITEFYYNESTARLLNYNGYKEKILNSKDNSVLDKSDIGKLSKNKLFVYDNYSKKYIFLTDYIGIKYSESEMMNVLPKFEEIENKIINIINIKNKKAKKYKKFDYLELIIQDKEEVKNNILSGLSNSKRVLKATDESIFKRIYFLSGIYLIVFGENPSENINKYNNGSNTNEQNRKINK